jgi:hypothetical protein
LKIRGAWGVDGSYDDVETPTLQCYVYDVYGLKPLLGGLTIVNLALRPIVGQDVHWQSQRCNKLLWEAGNQKSENRYEFKGATTS